MFVFKKKYFLIIESIKDIDLRNINIFNKFSIIYRNENKITNINKLMEFRRYCKMKRVDFYVSNDFGLASLLKADGLYVSAKNKNLRLAGLKNFSFKIIGSAHNLKEINLKVLQGCEHILFSRLFKTTYKFKKGFLGLIKFNLMSLTRKNNLVALGGIRRSNLNKLKIVNCESVALLSEIKKKPAITSRLF